MVQRCAIVVCLGVVALLALPAEAYIYNGNPKLTLEVTRPADDFQKATVTLDKVRINVCGGGYRDYQVDDDLDLTTPFEIDIASGDLCSVVVYWDTAMDILGTGSAFQLEYDEATTTVTLSGASQYSDLTPYEVVSGSYSGDAPRLYADIE